MDFLVIQFHSIIKQIIKTINIIIRQPQPVSILLVLISFFRLELSFFTSSQLGSTV